MGDSTDPLPRVAQAGGYGRQYPHRGHYFFNATIGALAFVGACFVLHAILPSPEVPGVTPKLRYFIEHKDEFDTLFIGSSHIYRHVDPLTFDQVAAEHGLATRSFNLAIGGMHPPESFYVLDQVLRAGPTKLKWVFVELEDLYPKWTKENRDTRRFLYWHNWPLTSLAVAKTIHFDERRWWKIPWQTLRSRTARVHLATFLKNLTNVGGAKDFEDWLAVRAQGDSNSEEFDQGRGYKPRPDIMSIDQARQYREQLQRSTATAGQRFLDPVTDKGYRDCARQIRDGGATPIFVVSPGSSQIEPRFHDPGSPGVVLAFNKANNYSALYDPRVRADPQHLTGEGAQEFTRLLAERFKTEVAGGE